MSDASKPDLHKSDMPPSAVYGTGASRNPGFKKYFPKLNPNLHSKKLSSIRNTSAGFSLLEVVLAIGVFGLALLGTIAGIAQMHVLQESARTLSTAAIHAQQVLEAIRLETETSLSSAVGTDWSAWADNNGCNTLDQETISVNFVSSDDDLEQVTLNVNWAARDHPMNYQVVTLVTERQ